ncbi:MAG TPA: UvrD-helicase domain-containing protein [Propionicimonas sp.]|nr:UvrD-helicase domain-containing protein [Propionicimonas sp.]
MTTPTQLALHSLEIPTAHDPAAPLPRGTTVLEASAGTGKTYAIAALATRYLAEGLVEADRIAVISFSRMASAELRSRVRERLGCTVTALTDHLAGLPVELDETDRLLADGPPEAVHERIARLHRAIAGLDGAAIMTIHQFCQAMLDELGVLAAQDPQATLVEDLSLVRDQVVNDVYLARYANATPAPPFDLATARLLAREAAELADAPLVPAAATGRAAERLAFAAAVRAELAARKLRLGLYSFDDQLSRLRESLTGPTGAAAAARLRRRCQVVLVDEFQDTDPVQWAILRDTYAGHVPLVLIGDPKQSIYAFRGADVSAYTDAVATAADTLSLLVNHRADAGVVQAVNTLFHGVTLGAGIPVPAVTASHHERRLLPSDFSGWAAAARIRCVTEAEPMLAAQARGRIVADLTAELVSLLDSDVQVVTKDGPRPVVASDVAILVNTNARGRAIADALTAAGVPVAFSGADSIFASHAAKDWLTLLRALEQPRQTATRAAMLTDFVGADLTMLALADETEFVTWASLLQGWARTLNAQGVAALFAAIQASSVPGRPGFAERVLGRPRGERDLTDFRHLAEILHAQHSDGMRGQTLVSWLAEATDRAAATSDRVRRLETDREAVQIMTVHKAKGLQFPIVLLPEAADLWLPDDDSGAPIAFHADGRRVLDLGGADAPGRAERLATYAQEEAEERLRGLYVALTRAQSHVTMWWSRTRQNTSAAPLHRLLFRRRDVLGAPAASYPVTEPPGDGHPRELLWLAEAGIGVEESEPISTSPRRDRPSIPDRLVLPKFTREIDQFWRRTSYSGLTEAVHARPPVALGELAWTEDEPAEESPAAAVASAGTPSPMAALPGGTGFGSLVHEVLENLDWHTSDEAELTERLLAAATEACAHFAIPELSAAALAKGLLPSLRTDLGRLTGGLPLAAIPIGDRLSELNFELALGGDAQAATLTATLGDVAATLRRWLPADDPLADYPDALADPLLAGQALRGFLTGSIDSVFRIPGPTGPRFVVVDYKTNRLGPVDLTLEHYSQAAMAAEMIRTHYPLQALLYCVALHRFLAARLPGYSPEAHLGGVGYLFVRGMGGSGVGPETGVFNWFPPAGLVAELSELLAGRRTS